MFPGIFQVFTTRSLGLRSNRFRRNCRNTVLARRFHRCVLQQIREHVFRVRFRSSGSCPFFQGNFFQFLFLNGAFFFGHLTVNSSTCESPPIDFFFSMVLGEIYEPHCNLTPNRFYKDRDLEAAGHFCRCLPN